MRFSIRRVWRSSIAAIVFCVSLGTSLGWAADLKDIQARGEIRHLGIRYANFVTGDGDGFDVDLVRGFAHEIGVRYTLVYTDFYTVLRDLLGHDVVNQNGAVTLTGEFPVRGDMIATGFTVLPWRKQVVLYSDPTFPSQVLLVARAASPYAPIKGSSNLTQDIIETKQLIGGHSLLVMERTCLDPANYDLKGKGLDLRSYIRSTNLNEMVPALLNKEAEFTLLDVPDVILDMQKWAGQIKVLGPISPEQVLAAAFPTGSPELRDAFNRYLRRLREEGDYDKLVDKYYTGVRRYFPAFFKVGG
ncbi:transporter substrate-binding domain-containing protein [Methylocapsa palsarum]|nr:transporter substrate-binding domain-containing protein [Methylocapsa palsarum]